MPLCGQCRAEVGEGDRFCKSCGARLTTGAFREPAREVRPAVGRPAYRKDEAVAALLAGILPLFGFMGIGQMYVNRWARGAVILLAAWLMPTVGALFLAAAWYAFPVIFLGILLIIATFGLYIWQIFDAHNLAKAWNQSVEATGHAPW